MDLSSTPLPLRCLSPLARLGLEVRLAATLLLGLLVAIAVVKAAVQNRALRSLGFLGLLAPYAVWYWHSMALYSRPGPWGPRWLQVVVARFFVTLMNICGARLIQLKPPPPPWERDRQCMVVWHPHGAYTTMALMHCGLQTVTGTPLQWYAGVAPVLFRLPLFREALLLLNARSVVSSSLEGLARAGCTIAVQPGGIQEQLQSDSSREIALFPQRLGFVRLAMRHGLPLLPVYIFGENQAYSTFGSLGRAVAAWSFRLCGAPIVMVAGHWGLPWIVPKATDIHVCWGRPVQVGPPNAAPTDEQVSQVFASYQTELCRLFDEHKAECLPADVAARGLEVRMHASRMHSSPRKP